MRSETSKAIDGPVAGRVIRIVGLPLRNPCSRPYGHGVSRSAYVQKALALLRAAMRAIEEDQVQSFLSSTTYRFASYQAAWHWWWCFGKKRAFMRGRATEVSSMEIFKTASQAYEVTVNSNRAPEV